MNKPIAVIVTITGIIMALFFGIYVMWCQGLTDVLTNITVVDNKLQINQLYLIFGSTKMILAPTVFAFVMNTTAQTAFRIWNHNDEENHS